MLYFSFDYLFKNVILNKNDICGYIYVIIFSQMVFEKIKAIPFGIAFIVPFDTLGFRKAEGTSTLRELMCRCSDACPKVSNRGEA